MKTKKIVTILALGLLLGGVFVGAKKTTAQENNALDNISQVQQEVQDPSYEGSIIVDESKYEGVSEEDESEALAGLATITADEAKNFAEDEIGSTASKVELGNENGSLVYEVQIGKQEVKVDAGNGSILHIENDDIDN